MENSKITFLDTSISLQDGKLNLNMFRKPESSDNVVNFKKSISPKGYKWSNFIREIHRCNNTTSNNYFRDEAIEKTKNIFLKSKFPANIMDQKISEIKLRNFQPSEN